jgi:hypothetical protein
VHDPFGNCEALLGLQFNGFALDFDDEAALEAEEEFVFIVVLVPVKLALQNAKPNDGVVDLAQRLVVPGLGAGGDEGGNIDELERFVTLVQVD